MTPRESRRLLSVLLGSVLVLTATGCGSDDNDSEGSAVATTAVAAEATTVAAETSTTAASAPVTSGSVATTAAAAATTSTTTAADTAAWQEVISAANEEGKVTIYSSQGLDQLNAFAAEFEKVYPEIDVEVVRLTDNDSTAKIDVEREVGSFTADMWVINSASTMEQKATEGGWFVAPTGPNFSADDYLPEYLHNGGYFEVGAAVLTFGWNTERYPAGLTDYTGLLDPELAGGKIAVIDAAVSPAAVDFYLFLEETYGTDFVDMLAAQEPRLYPSALPIGEALGAGEVAAAAFTLPLIAQKEAGAPVDFSISDRVWGTRYFGSIVDGAPHPNAAQLLANFMVSPEGQAAVQKNQASVLPDIPGTLTTNDRIRVQDLAALTPDAVAEYMKRWDSLFR